MGLGGSAAAIGPGIASTAGMSAAQIDEIALITRTFAPKFTFRREEGARRSTGQQFGDLNGVQRRALAQVVTGDEQRQPAPFRHPGIPADPADQRLVDTRGRQWVGTSTTLTPGAPASSSRARSGEMGSENSALIDSEWPVNTGTRTQVPLTARSGMPRILRLSLRSFWSSSVSPEPSSTREPANGITLNAIGAT